jgi:hypothetical protein
MSAYRSYYLRRYHRGTIPRPVLIAGAAAVVIGAAGATAHHHGHHHSQPASASAPAGSTTPGKNEQLGDSMASGSPWNWPSGQVSCLNWLWTRESGWSQYADTRVTGLDPAGASVFAYGIAQARPATKMPLAAQPASLGGRSDRVIQIRWGLGYIAATYITPCSAWAHETSDGWY